MDTPTCRDTRGRSRGRSRDPDRWPLLWTGTAHTAASPTGRRPQLHYGTSGGRVGKTERHNKTHTNRRTDNRVQRWTVNLKIQTEKVKVLFLDSLCFSLLLFVTRLSLHKHNKTWMCSEFCSILEWIHLSISAAWGLFKTLISKEKLWGLSASLEALALLCAHVSWTNWTLLTVAALTAEIPSGMRKKYWINGIRNKTRRRAERPKDED